jgi:hypothetical protein
LQRGLALRYFSEGSYSTNDHRAIEGAKPMAKKTSRKKTAKKTSKKGRAKKGR